jgi:hypothetical protein
VDYCFAVAVARFAHDMIATVAIISSDSNISVEITAITIPFCHDLSTPAVTAAAQTEE